MFTVTWHYEGEGIGSFRDAIFPTYAGAANAMRCTTLLPLKGQTALVSAMLANESGYVFEFWAPVTDQQLIEQ